MARRFDWLLPCLSVIGREIFAARLLLPAALVLGCFAPLSALIASQMGYDAESARDLTAVISALFLGSTALALLGFSSLAPEVASGRLAFYLARPIPAWALWIGKLVARALMVMLAILSVLIPSFVLGGRPVKLMALLYDPPHILVGLARRPWHWNDEGPFANYAYGTYEPIFYHPPAWLAVLVVAMVIFAIAHLFGFALRVRGPWTVVDLVAASTMAFFLLSTASRFSILGAVTGAFVVLVVPMVLAVGIVLLSGWAQVRWGGVSRQRSHAILSLLIWGTLGLALLGLDLLARDLTAQPLEDYEALLDVVPARQGSWAVMTGLDGVSGAATVFLVDTASDRRIRLGERTRFTQRPIFSADGEHLFFWQCGARFTAQRATRSCYLYHLDLRQQDPRQQTIALGYEQLRAFRLAFAPDGSKLAIWQQRAISVIDMSGRELWRTKLPSSRTAIVGFGHLFFEDAESLVVIRARAAEKVTSTGSVEVAGEIKPPFLAEVWSLESGGDPRLRSTIPWNAYERFRSVEHHLGALQGDMWTIQDLAGAPVHRFAGAQVDTGRLLSDGTLLLIDRGRRGESSQLLILDRLSEPVGLSRERAAYRLKGWLYPGGEPEPGRMLVGAAPSPLSPSPVGGWPSRPWFQGSTTLVIDTQSASVERSIEGFAALPLNHRPGELGADWLLDRQGFPHRLTLETGHLEPVLER